MLLYTTDNNSYFTLQFTLYTLHYNSHFTLYTLQLTLFTLHSTLYTLHSNNCPQQFQDAVQRFAGGVQRVLLPGQPQLPEYLPSHQGHRQGAHLAPLTHVPVHRPLRHPVQGVFACVEVIG